MKCALWSKANGPSWRISCRHRSRKGRVDQLFLLYLASFCSSHLRPSGKVRCLETKPMPFHVYRFDSKSGPAAAAVFGSSRRMPWE